MQHFRGSEGKCVYIIICNVDEKKKEQQMSHKKSSAVTNVENIEKLKSEIIEETQENKSRCVYQSSSNT